MKQLILTALVLFTVGAHVESVKLVDGELHVIYRQQTLYSYEDDPAPDFVWKEIYGVRDGEIQKIAVQDAVVTPERVLPEKVKFGERRENIDEVFPTVLHPLPQTVTD